MRATTIPLVLMALLIGTTAALAQQAKLSHCVVTLIDEAEVPAREAGVLVTLNVRKGVYVEKGSLLGQIDDVQARMSKRAAELEYEAAKKEAENDISVRAARSASLVSGAEHEEALEANRRQEGTITASEVRRLQLTFERSKLQIELAQLEFAVTRYQARVTGTKVEAAEDSILRRKIDAPLDGVVAEVHKHAGEWLSPGDPVVRIVRMDKLRVEGFLNASEYAPQNVLHRPVTAEVRLSGGQVARITSTVSFVSPLVEASGEYRIAADIENRQAGDHWLISPGMGAEMTIDVGNR